jgi:RNA polymerase sigma-70 factor (ECF subfamily)
MKEDRASQKMLYQQFYGYAMSVCLRYCKSRDEALEVLNDGFLKVFTRLNKYDSEKSFKGWIRKIMINTALDHYRKHLKHYKTSSSSTDIQNLTDLTVYSENVLNRLAYEDLLAMVQQLSTAYRTVFNLHVMDGYTHEEIAEMLEISAGTSKSNLFKAKAKLQEMIKNNYQDAYARQGR